MPSHRNICVYDSTGHELCHIDAEEAHQLCADGSHLFICRFCGTSKGEGRCLVGPNHTFAVFEATPEKHSGRRSDCSLTDRDMQRNVGITEGSPGEPPARGQIRRTRARIDHWAKASKKNRSVTIVPAAAL
jgi:hypothetical protein